MPTLLAILSSLAGLFASLVMLVLLAAGGANSKPDQAAKIQLWMIIIGVVAALGLLSSVALLFAKKPWLAAALGGAPAVLSIIMLVLMFITEW